MLDSLVADARCLLVFASFAGLSAALRVRFGLHRFVAPFTAACGVIVALMLAGMAGLLEPALLALYALGALGLIYAYGLRRARPEWGLILALLAACALLYWRYAPCQLWRTDDFSHWGHAARHLLLTDRFPNGGDSYIYFQSYPLGSACFIYYLARFTSRSEGFMLFAQSALYLLLFLPAFSLVRRQRRIYYPILAALFLLLFCHCFLKILLTVDLLLAFFGIGIAAAIHTPPGDDIRTSCIAALPGMIAVTLVKNSGLFFTALSATLLFRAARRCGVRRGRRWALALAGIGLPAAAYLLWTLHIRLRFPAALDTKHAVSLTAYLGQLRAKGPGVVGQIALGQLRALIHLRGTLALAAPILALISLLLLLAARKLPAPERRRVGRAYLFGIGAYALWYIMLFLMYVFSMPEDEALGLASFSRYNGTGLVYATGLIALLLLDTLQRRDLLPRAMLRALSRLSALGLAAVLALAAWPGGAPGFRTWFERNPGYTELRQRLIAAREQSGLEPLARSMIYCQYDLAVYDRTLPHLYYEIKYAFDSGDVLLITDEASNPGRYYAGTRWAASEIDSASEFIAENIDGCDALIVVDESAAFEAELDAFLETYTGDTPVVCAAQSFPGADA